MSALRVIGVDPGPVPGIVELHFVEGRLIVADVLQCTENLAGTLFECLVTTPTTGRNLVQVEKFVVGRRSSRSSTAHAGEITRLLVGELAALATQAGAEIVQRSASQVKPWATDARLEAAGLLEACKGMRHARDAARHALFAACHDGGIPDPLSKDWNR